MKYSAFGILFAAMILNGCATNLTKPVVAPQPTTVKLSEFSKIEMKSVTISEKFASSGANQKAAKKVNEILTQNMSMIFPNFKALKEGEDFSQADERTLRISPVVKEIKFIGGAARFWVGSMAGSSAILMEVDYVDSQDGSSIGKPQFYRDANAMAGAWSVGHSDNRMLEVVAQDIINYSSYNK